MRFSGLVCAAWTSGYLARPIILEKEGEDGEVISVNEARMITNKLRQ